MSSLNSSFSFLLLCIVSASGLNISLLLINDRGSTSPKPSSKTEVLDSVTVYHVDDITVFSFLHTDYPTMSDWLVVVDTRPCSCPYKLYPNKLLGYITFHPGICALGNQTTLFRVQTTPFDYRHLVVDAGNYSGSDSNSVGFLFDDSGKEYRSQISMSPLNEFLFYLELEISLDHISEMLANLTVKTDVRYIFLMATSTTVEHVVKEAYRLNMLCGRYHWLLFTTDGVTPNFVSSVDHSVVLVKDPRNMLSVGNVEKLMKLVEDVFVELDRASDCDCVEHCETCQNSFTDLLKRRIRENDGIFFQGEQPSDIFPLYKYIGNDSDSLVQVATWSPEGGVVSDQQLFVRGSKEVVLRIAAVLDPPFVVRNASGGYSGYSVDVLDEIAKIVGFTYTIKECNDGHYGTLNDKGEWTGCIRNIVNGDSDLIAGALTVTADREAVLDFTLPYYDFAGIQIIMKKQETEISLFYFADVFTPLAWLCLGVVIAVTSLLLLLFDRYAPSSRKQDRGEETEDQIKTFDLKESIWFVIGSLTMTGAGAPPHSFSARLLVAGFWFFSVIMMSTFTANLAAFLTVSRMGASISSMAELAAQSDIKYSVVAQSSVMTYFQRMSAIEENFYSIWKEMSLGGLGNNTSLAVWDYPLGDKYVNIWKTIQDTGLLNSTDQAIEKITRENFAFITDSPIIKYLTYRNCDLTSIGDMFSIRPYAFALKEKSIYTKKISSAILELQKRRMLETLKRRWWDEGKLDCPESSTDKGLDLKSLTGSFIVVAVGIASGLLVLTLEHFWNRFSKKEPPVVAQMKPRLSSLTSGGDTSRTEVTVLDDKDSVEDLNDTLDDDHKE